MTWIDHDHRSEYADTQHGHGFYDLHDVAAEHHRHYDTESEVAGLREDLGRALGRIRELEDRCAALERQTPQAQQARYEADLAAADLAASGLDRHGRDCTCPYCWIPDDDEPEPEGSRLADRDAYIGTWSNQDVTRRTP